MRAAAVLAPARRERDDAARLGKRAQVEPVVPGEIERAVAVRHAGGKQFRLDLVERDQRSVKARPVTEDANVVPHGVEQFLSQAIHIAALRAERRQRARNLRIEHGFVRRAMAGIGGDPVRHRITRDAAKHGGIGDAIAAEPVGAVHAARILAGHEQAWNFRGRIHGAFDGPGRRPGLGGPGAGPAALCPGDGQPGGRRPGRRAPSPRSAPGRDFVPGGDAGRGPEPRRGASSGRRGHPARSRGACLPGDAGPDPDCRLRRSRRRLVRGRRGRPS